MFTIIFIRRSNYFIIVIEAISIGITINARLTKSDVVIAVTAFTN